MNLHVLTYNVFGMPWGLQSIETILLWAFYKTDVEILCLQEVFSEEHVRAIRAFCSKKESHWSCWFPSVDSTWLSKWPFFSSLSGLCVLVKNTIHVLHEPQFIPFKESANVDSFVQKGFFHLCCKKDNTVFHIVNTHFQSDFTECNCKIRYPTVRKNQELQLYEHCKQLENCLFIGDFNMSKFTYLQFVHSSLEPTLIDSGESLDHCLCLPNSKIQAKNCTYFHAVNLSDHIPVLFQIRFR